MLHRHPSSAHISGFEILADPEPANPIPLSALDSYLWLEAHLT